MSEDRKFFRFGVAVDVEVELPDGEIRVLKTHNLSQGGIFLSVDGLLIPPIDTELKVKIKQPLGDGEEPSQIKVVVRHTSGLGMGLEFIDS